MNEYEKERLEDLETDMKDNLKSWKQSEQEIIDAIEWRNKMSLRYAESAVKYFTYKQEVENK